MIERISTMCLLILVNLSFTSKETDLERKGIIGKASFIQFEDGDSIWYNRNGMEVLEITNRTKISRSYDSDNDIIESSVVNKYSKEVLLMRKLINEEKGKKYYIQYDPDLPKLIDSCVCIEIKDKSKHKLTKICNNRQGKRAFKYVYHFDKIGNLLEQNYYRNNESIPNYTWKFTFNKFNKMSSNAEYNRNKLSVLHKFYFNKNGLEICTKSYDENKIEWSNDSSFYNSKNELIMEKYNWNNENIIEYYCDYKYDDNRNWVYRKRIKKQDTTEENRVIRYFE